jgi:hypothetical protein
VEDILKLHILVEVHIYFLFTPTLLHVDARAVFFAVCNWAPQEGSEAVE